MRAVMLALACALASASAQPQTPMQMQTLRPQQQQQPPPPQMQASLPNGYATLRTDDLRISSPLGAIAWTRQWDGVQWRFNPQWESLSQSWKNLTGSQSADTTGTRPGSAGSSGGIDGCWVWVDEDWQPTTGTGAVAAAIPMVAARTTPFNRVMGEGLQAGGDYAPGRRVNIDYAALCPGASGRHSSMRDMEGIRRANELYLGDGTRYAFNNRSFLEKRAIRELAADSAGPAGRGARGGAGPANSPATQPVTQPVTNPKGYRWTSKSGDWVDYNTQGQATALGDRNDNTLWLQRDAQGRVTAVKNAQGAVLLSLHYTGDLLTEVRDPPDAGIAGDLPVRSIRYAYDSLNRLTEVTDARGHTVAYRYDSANRITGITDQEGRQTQLAYDGETLRQRIAPDGGVTDYAFDYDDTHKQFLSKITGPPSGAGRRVDDYTHNRAGKLVSQHSNGQLQVQIRYDSGARAQSRSNARGFTTRTVRDEFGNIVRTEHPDGSVEKSGYDPVHLGLTQHTDELGTQTRYDYDAKGNLVRQVQAEGQAEERTTEYRRDARGLAVGITRKGRSAGEDATWRLEYDERGHLRRATDPEGHVRSYVYNRLGQLIAYTDPLGNASTYATDLDGNLTEATDPLGRVRRYRYDKVGNLIEQTDARGQSVRMAYDAMNRLTRTTNAVGGQARIDYDTYGQVIRQTDEDGRTTELDYDSMQRLIRQADALGNSTRLGYQIADGSGAGGPGSLFQPTDVQYPTYRRQMRYDARERLTSETVHNPGAGGTQTATSARTYDARGQLVAAQDAYGKSRRYQYDALGQITEATDALGAKTRAAYDARGNLIEFIDAKGQATRYAYDRNDRLLSETLPLGQVTRYQYDAAGRLAEREDAAGIRRRYTYDAASRITGIQHLQAGAAIRTITQAWDAEDRLVAWSDTDASRPAGQQTTSATLAYDDAGRKTRETVTYPNPSGGSYSLGYGYQYSPSGHKTQLTWADGTAITYGWSGHGELQSVTIPGEGSLNVTRYQWRAPARTLLPGGSTQDRRWDGRLQLESLKSVTPGQQATLSLANTWGLQQEVRTAQRSDSAAGLSATQNARYAYDDEQRLTQVTTDSGGLFNDTETFELDAVANRTRHSRFGSGPWSYDANNRLTSRPGPGGGPAVTYQWDANGNLAARTEGARSSHYAYDSDNRITQVHDTAGRLIARYGYDPHHRRTWKEQYRDKAGTPLAQALRTYYLYSDEGLIAEATQPIELDGQGLSVASTPPAITTQYGPRPDSEFTTGTLFVKTRNSNGQDTIAYYHHNHLHTPLQATDRHGSVVWAARYDAFGQASILTASPTAERPTITSHLRLPGQYEDVETGLHYNWHRFYDPAVGRYVQADPIGLEGGVNRFAYVDGNPVKYTDPNGLQVVLLPPPPITPPPPIRVDPDIPYPTEPPSITWPKLLPDWCVDLLVLMAKGGNQNKENEYSREARNHPDPCSWLKIQYDGAKSAIDREKIKTAQKALGCRRNSTQR